MTLLRKRLRLAVIDNKMTTYRYWYRGEVVSKEQYQLLKEKENEQFKRDVQQLLEEKKLVVPQVKPKNKNKDVTVKEFHNFILEAIDSY
jgi:hypothetical protein